MPLYKEQGIVLRAVKLGEADKIVSILTQGSGKVRAVAKGIRRTNSKFGARLEPLTHVSLLLYRGRNLDTVTQAEIVSPFRTIGGNFELIAAGETLLESVDKVAEEHERNVRLFLLLLSGLRALEARPRDAAAVAGVVLGRAGWGCVPGLCRARCRKGGRAARSVAGRARPDRPGLGRGYDTGDRRPPRGQVDPVRLRRISPGTADAKLLPPRPPAESRPDQLMSFLSDLDLERLPRHVAIVMDGNGRWARQRGLPRTKGHEAGEEALYDVVLGGLDI